MTIKMDSYDEERIRQIAKMRKIDDNDVQKEIDSISMVFANHVTPVSVACACAKECLGDNGGKAMLSACVSALIIQYFDSIDESLGFLDKIRADIQKLDKEMNEVK